MKRTIESTRDWRTFWAHAVEHSATGDLFRQVGRTVVGVPEPKEQLDILVGVIAEGLKLRQDDVLLDLCCGNGLVTVRLSRLCGSIVAVDYSNELIQVARTANSASNITYVNRSVERLLPRDLPSTGPTKICMIAGMQYFTSSMIRRLLVSLRSLARVDLELLFTAVPDSEKLDKFYNTPERRAEYERRSAAGNEAIGTWWDRTHLVSIFQQEGYEARAADQNPSLLTAHYRFDVLAHLSI